MPVGPVSQTKLLVIAAAVLSVLSAGLCLALAVTGAKQRDQPTGELVGDLTPSAVVSSTPASPTVEASPADVATSTAPVVPPPAPVPTTQPPPPQPSPPPPVRTTAGTQRTTGGSVYYPNCDAARAAGAAPLHPGEPGYR